MWYYEIIKVFAFLGKLFDSSLPPKYVFDDILFKIKGKCGEHEFSHEVVRKTGSGKVLFKDNFKATPNSNTYLTGTPKYDFKQYKDWLKKLENL